MNAKFFAAAALAAFACASAHAADFNKSKLYIGGGLGLADSDVSCAGSGCDSSDTGFKLFGGYHFTPELALELSYIDFGSARRVGGYLVTVDQATSAFGASAAYTYKLNTAWSLQGRLGLASVDSKATAAVPIIGASTSDSESNTAVLFGLSLGYAIAPHLTVHAGWDFTSGKLQGEDSNVNLLSAGLSYSF